MKRGLFLLLFISLVFSSYCQNLVLNPGVEYWSITGKPTDWTNTQNCLKDSVFVRSGGYACRQDGGTGSRDLGQKFSVSPGKNYRFSFYYKTGSATTGNGCRIWSEWLDTSKVSISDPASVPVLHSGYMKSDTWQQFSCDITAPERAGYFYLLVRTLSNSVTYWDEFVFERNIPTGFRNKELLGIKVFPNPAHDYLNISNLEDLQYIEIQNLMGKIVWYSNYKGETEVIVPVFGMEQGLYILRIRTADKMITKKIIVE